MAREQMNTSDPFTAVVMEPIVIDGKEQKDHHILVTDDDGERVHVKTVSKNYNLIPNELLYQAALDIMSRSEYTFSPLKTHWDGKRYIEYFTTDEPVVRMRNGHDLHLGTAWRNSYIGDSLAVFYVFWHNAACMNEWHSGNLFGQFEVRHTSNNAFDNSSITDALSNMARGANSGMKILPQLYEMQETPIGVSDLCQAKSKNLIPNAKWSSVIDRLEHEEETAYGLFQALTGVTSHEMSGVSAMRSGEFVTQHFLSSKTPQVMGERSVVVEEAVPLPTPY